MEGEYDEARWTTYSKLDAEWRKLRAYGENEDYWDHPQAIEARGKARVIAEQINAMGEVVRPPQPPEKPPKPRKVNFYEFCPIIGTEKQNGFVAFLARKAGFPRMIDAVAWALEVDTFHLKGDIDSYRASRVIDRLKTKTGTETQNKGCAASNKGCEVAWRAYYQALRMYEIACKNRVPLLATMQLEGTALKLLLQATDAHRAHQVVQ